MEFNEPLMDYLWNKELSLIWILNLKTMAFIRTRVLNYRLIINGWIYVDRALMIWNITWLYLKATIYLFLLIASIKT